MPIINGGGGGSSGAVAESVIGYAFAPNLTALSPATNMYFVKVYVPADVSVSKYGFSVGTQNGSMILAIYTSAGVKVTAETAFSVPASGARTQTITGGPVTLTAGEYFIGIQPSGTTATFGCMLGTVASPPVGATFVVANTFASGAPASITPVAASNTVFMSLCLG